MATEYKEQSGPKVKDVEKSIAEFFEVLADKLVQTQASAPKVPDNSEKLQAYSKAWEGIANSNVSKSEGFSLNVEVHKDYDAIAQRVSAEWKKRKLAKNIYQADIKMVK